MLIDCDSCTARPHACGDCIVTHLLQVGPARSSTEDSWEDPWDVDGQTDVDGHTTASTPVVDPRAGGRDERDRTAELTESELAAVAVLSAGGLVPPLRLVNSTRPAAPAPPTGTSGRAGRRAGRSRTG